MQRQVRPVLLDGAERLDEDAALAEPAGDVRRTQVGEHAIGARAARYWPDHRWRPMTHDADAIVIGAGHNGLVTAAYLAKAGLRTLLLEARSIVGGTAASEPFAGGTVNICNCDHITFRTTPVIDDLDLASFGLRYIEIEPTQVGHGVVGRPGVAALARRRAHDRRARRHPSRRGRRLPALPAGGPAGRRA